ncbi:MAG: O-acetyl-ADP-ribose deacetylase (regulator of RNase III) [Acidimicrobiales bacterium]
MAEHAAELVAVLGDITAITCDAIVNAANTSLLGGGGVDGAIHRVGGPAILDQCRDIVAKQGGCQPGDAVITTAGALPSRYVIHTVGPVFDEAHAAAHDRTLASSYRRSLDLAAAHELQTLAFPNISTGVYGFPKIRAAGVAIEAVRSWLSSDVVATRSIERLTFVCFDDENYNLYLERLLPGTARPSTAS